MTERELTDAELTRALAGRVMGGFCADDGITTTSETRFKLYKGKVLIGIAWELPASLTVGGATKYDRSWRDWRPLESMDDAMMLVEALQSQDWDYTLGSVLTEEGEGHSAAFERGALSLYDDRREEAHEATAPTPQRAIALAALGVAGVEVEG